MWPCVKRLLIVSKRENKEVFYLLSVGNCFLKIRHEIQRHLRAVDTIASISDCIVCEIPRRKEGVGKNRHLSYNSADKRYGNVLNETDGGHTLPRQVL